jgi:response regulator RpfG family c-di-GMP phosphodiesterase
MKGKSELLCVSQDAVLNRTRRLILERCFDVKVAQNEAEAIALLAGHRFALVLLCYSLSGEGCRAVVDKVHSLSSTTRILLLGEGQERVGLGPRDEEFNSRRSADLVRKAASMAGVAPDVAEQCATDEAAPGQKQA